MKKIFLFIVVLTAAANLLGAQTLQTGDYDDGRILAYITRGGNTGNVRPGQNRTSGAENRELVIENISDGEVEIRYCFKSAAVDYNNRIVNEKLTYRDVTLRAGKTKSETGVESRGGGRGYYVDSFSILNVKVKSISALQSILRSNSSGNSTARGNSGTRGNAAEQQTPAVPEWARGIWYISESRAGGKFAEITSRQYISVSAVDCTKVEGDFVWFGKNEIMITRSNSHDQIFLAIRARSGNTFTTLYR